jgi:hypothetical protein
MIVKEINVEIFRDLDVFTAPEYAEVVFGMPSVRRLCMYVYAPREPLNRCTNFFRIWHLTVYPS